MRLKAVVGVSYPDAASLKIVEKAGGLSKLTDQQRARVKVKNVKAGGFCDDIPESARKGFLRLGYIRKVSETESSEVKPKTRTRKSSLKR
jgi:hypothetical protein